MTHDLPNLAIFPPLKLPHVRYSIDRLNLLLEKLQNLSPDGYLETSLAPHWLGSHGNDQNTNLIVQSILFWTFLQDHNLVLIINAWPIICSHKKVSSSVYTGMYPKNFTISLEGIVLQIKHTMWSIMAQKKLSYTFCTVFYSSVKLSCLETAIIAPLYPSCLSVW